MKQTAEPKTTATTDALGPGSPETSALGAYFPSGPILSSEFLVSAHSQSGNTMNVVSALCQKHRRGLGDGSVGMSARYAVMRPLNPSKGDRQVL